MARVIVGADENAGDVAARLLELADHQNDVHTRTDGAGLSFEVPDSVYKAYVGKTKRGTDEQRANSVQRMISQQGADDPDVIRSDDEVPDAARVVEPGDVEDGFAGGLNADELPDAARVADPPANGEASNAGDGTNQGDPDPAPAPRKRASRTRATKSTAAKSTPAAAGTDK